MFGWSLFVLLTFSHEMKRRLAGCTPEPSPSLSVLGHFTLFITPDGVQKKRKKKNLPSPTAPVSATAAPDPASLPVLLDSIAPTGILTWCLGILNLARPSY